MQTRNQVRQLRAVCGYPARHRHYLFGVMDAKGNWKKPIPPERLPVGHHDYIVASGDWTCRFDWSRIESFFRCNQLNDRADACVVEALNYISFKLHQADKFQSV